MNANLVEIPYLQIVSDSISSSGQPSREVLSRLKEIGYSAVLNISPEDTKNFIADEGEIVLAQGMDYVHLPMDCSNLKKEQYESFAENMDKLSVKGKVLVHCGMNIKSSGFLHIYRILKLGQEEDFALSELAKTPEHEPKWYSYFKEFGLKS